MAMKMLAKRSGFVDGRYAKFYALKTVSYCVWDPSAIAPLHDRFLPSCRSCYGDRKQSAFLLGLLGVSVASAA
jgi:hypothetical protein